MTSIFVRQAEFKRQPERGSCIIMSIVVVVDATIAAVVHQTVSKVAALLLKRDDAPKRVTQRRKSHPS